MFDWQYKINKLLTKFLFQPHLLNVSFCMYCEFMWKPCSTSPVSSVYGTFSWWHFSTMLCDICVNNWCIAPLKVRDNGRKAKEILDCLKTAQAPASPATVTRNVSIYERPRLRGSFRQADRLAGVGVVVLRYQTSWQVRKTEFSQLENCHGWVKTCWQLMVFFKGLYSRHFESCESGGCSLEALLQTTVLGCTVHHQSQRRWMSVKQ